MATTADISNSIENSAHRLEQMFSTTGWNKQTTMVSTFGGNAPTLTVEFIVSYANIVAARVKVLRKNELEEESLGEFISSTIPLFDAIQFLNFQSDPSAVIANYLTLLNAVDARLPPIPQPPPPEPKVDWEDLRTQTSLLPKDLSRRLRAIEARLSDLEPRSNAIGQMIAEIESAHEAADQLPTDLAELRSKKDEVLLAAISANESLSVASEAARTAQSHAIEIEAHRLMAESVINRSEQALRGATGVGLAAAFEKRKASLSKAGIGWTIGLIFALTAGILIGAERVSALKEVMVSGKSASIIWANVLIALLGIGGPVWFAWVSTKQIWTAFRLAEDYAFKASMSKAYEGYRNEALDLDPALRNRLFAAALTRLEEAPIRLLDSKSHGSPLQELLDNPAIRKSLDNIPDIKDMILGLIPSARAPQQSTSAVSIAPRNARLNANDSGSEVNVSE